MSARDRYVAAAVRVAIGVDVTERLASDPSQAGDRSPAADAARKRAAEIDLAEFRSARDAFMREVGR